MDDSAIAIPVELNRDDPSVGVIVTVSTPLDNPVIIILILIISSPPTNTPPAVFVNVDISTFVAFPSFALNSI